MAMWYYALDGKQQGPVDDRTIRQLIAQGQVRGADLVWKEGMKQWAAAQSIVELNPVPRVAASPVYTAPPAYQQRYSYNTNPTVYSYQPAQPSSKGLAIGGFICSLVGLFTCLPATAGLVLSAVALSQMKSHGNRDGQGLATAGLVIGIIVSVIYLVIYIIVFLSAMAGS